MESYLEDSDFPQTSLSSTNSSSNSITDKNYSEIFEEVCPYYMSIGVSYEEFWYGDFAICKYAREAEKLRKKKTNQEMWWNTIYMFRALLDASPAFHDFGDGKKTKIKFSIEEPFPMTAKEAEEAEQKKQEKEREEFLARMIAITQDHNKSMKEKLLQEQTENEQEKETEK